MPNVQRKPPTIARRSSSSARAPLARRAHRAVCASECPDRTGIAACTPRNHASIALSLCTVALPLSRVESVKGASDVSGACRGCHGSHRGEESASGVVCAFVLFPSVRGGRSVRAAAIVVSSWCCGMRCWWTRRDVNFWQVEPSQSFWTSTVRRVIAHPHYSRILQCNCEACKAQTHIGYFSHYDVSILLVHGSLVR